MLYKEIMAVCSEIHTKHTDSLGRKWNFRIVNLVASKVTTGFRTFITSRQNFILTCIVVLPRKLLKENVLIGSHILFIDNSAWLECRRIHIVYQAITHFPLGWPTFVFVEGSTVSLVSRTKWGSRAQHRPAQLVARSAYKRDATPEVRHSSTLREKRTYRHGCLQSGK